MAGSVWARVALAYVAMTVCIAPETGMAAPSQQEVCKDQFYTVTHDGDVKSTTINATALKWVVGVAKDHGMSWASLPEPYPALCVQQSPNAPYKWHCVISRKPCRMQTFLTPLTRPRPGLKPSN